MQQQQQQKKKQRGNDFLFKTKNIMMAISTLFSFPTMISLYFFFLLSIVFCFCLLFDGDKSVLFFHSFRLSVGLLRLKELPHMESETKHNSKLKGNFSW